MKSLLPRTIYSTLCCLPGIAVPCLCYLGYALLARGLSGRVQPNNTPTYMGIPFTDHVSCVADSLFPSQIGNKCGTTLCCVVFELFASRDGNMTSWLRPLGGVVTSVVTDSKIRNVTFFGRIEQVNRILVKKLCQTKTFGDVVIVGRNSVK